MAKQNDLKALITLHGFVPLTYSKEGELAGGYVSLLRASSNNCSCSSVPNDCKCSGNNCNCPPQISNSNCECQGNNCDCTLTVPVPTEASSEGSSAQRSYQDLPGFW